MRLKIHDKGIAAVRTAPPVVAKLRALAEEITAEANDSLPEGVGYNHAVHRGSSARYGPWVVARIWTQSNHAKRSNAIRQTLVRAVQSR